MTAEPRILAFDTSGAHCAAALLSGGKVVATRYRDMARGQAEHLIPMLEETLADQGVGWRDLDGIGVGVGPGNFTGIRIAVSAARGLALSLDIPAVGVNLFDALACGSEDDLFLSLAAPRDQIYWQTRIGAAESGIGQDLIADLPAVPDELIAIGARSQEVAAALGLEHRSASYSPTSAIARIAADRLGTDIAPPKPLYIRAADAAPASDPPPVILP